MAPNFRQSVLWLNAGLPKPVIIRNEKTPGCLGLIGDYTTQLYLGIISSHYKDPFFDQSGFNGMSAKGFVAVAQ